MTWPSGIQAQIDYLEQGIYDLQSSPSGVLAYSAELTVDTYDETWGRIVRDIEYRIVELNKSIVDASGSLRVLVNGITFHRH